MRWAILVLNLLALLLVGCHAATPSPYPQDPLFLSQQPIEKKTMTPGPALFAAIGDPRPPAFPKSAIVSPRDETSQPHVAGTLAVGSKAVPLVIQPAVQSQGPVLSEQDPTALYAAAPDCRWLQGILEKHHQGYYELRFSSPTLSDPYAGKVRLEADPRLLAYADGDFVWVEGEPLPEFNWGTPPTRPPCYRIHRITKMNGP